MEYLDLVSLYGTILQILLFINNTFHRKSFLRQNNILYKNENNYVTSLQGEIYVKISYFYIYVIHKEIKNIYPFYLQYFSN